MEFLKFIRGIPTSFIASRADVELFENSPIVSVEVERLFSCLKRLLAPQRKSFTVETHQTENYHPMGARYVTVLLPILEI